MNATRRIRDALAAIGLAVITLVAYHDILRLWWMYDDAYHLNVIAVTPVSHFATSSAFWRAFVAPVFTPLLLLSLAGDVAIVNHNPYGFYLHQLLAAAVVAPLLYVFLRLWLPWSAAFLVALTAVAGAPMMQIVTLLMLRHYVEGLLLAVLAAIAHVVGVRKNSDSLTACSAALALGAMLAKEVYVPLPFLLAFVPNGRSLRRLGPHALALTVYSVWRIALLGPALRGYGWTVRPSGWARVMATLPFRCLRTLAMGCASGQFLMLFLLVAVALVAIKLRLSRMLIIVAALAAVGPVLPVSIELEPRYALGIWLALVMTAAFAAIAMPRAGTALLVGAAICAIAANRQVWPGEMQRLRQMSTEGRAFAMLLPGDVLRNPTIPPSALGELQRLTGSPAVGSYDDVLLCERQIVPARLFQFDTTTRQVRAISWHEVERSCAMRRPLPLYASFTLAAGDSFYWTLGPRQDGRYRFILGSQAFDVPRDGGFRLPTLRHVVLRVAYVAPEGWTSYSPALTLNLDDRREVLWRSR